MSQPESLLHRLAGPSTGKAGVIQDQTEINRIIAEASKGSTYYENEKRKDQLLTEKIEKVLKIRDDLLEMAHIPSVEAAADKVMQEVESTRDLSQTIVHFDLDSFYASVEILDNPELKGKAFCVGNSVLTTASYEARKYGVRSAMPGYIARKLCPGLIFVDLHFNRYIEKSRQVMAILKEYDSTMAKGGLDEAYLNITKYCKEHDIGPQLCVTQIRERIHNETDLTISAGIASNIMLAKICSDKNKPNGQFSIPPEREAIMAFMRDLSVRKIPGIGRVTEQFFNAIGIRTCGDIYTLRAHVSLLDKYYHLKNIMHYYLGIASNIVQPGIRETRKSVGVERTFKAISDPKKILQKLYDIATWLEEDLERTGWAGKQITLKWKLDTYRAHTKVKNMNKWITKKQDLFEVGRELLIPELPVRVRLLGLRVTQLKDLRVEEDPGLKRYFQETTSPCKKRKLEEEVEVINLLDSDAEDDADELLNVLGEEHDDTSGFREIKDPPDDDDEEDNPFIDGRDDDNDFDPRSDRASLPPSTQSRAPDLFGVREKEADKHSLHTGTQGTGNSEEQGKGFGIPHPKRMKSAPPTSSQIKVEKEDDKPYLLPINIKPKARQLRLSVTAFARFKHPQSTSPKLELEENIGDPSETKPNLSTPSKIDSFSSNPKSKAMSRTKSKSKPSSFPSAKKERHHCPLCTKMIEGDNAALNAHIDWCLSREAIKEASAG